MNNNTQWLNLLKTGTAFGLVLGFTTVLGSYLLEGGNFDALFAIAPITIVIGGTIAAGIIGSSLEQVARIPKLLGVALLPKKLDTRAIINQIVSLAVLARREGIISIERRLNQVDHPFLRKIFQVAVDGADPESLRDVAEAEKEFIEERHRAKY